MRLSLCGGTINDDDMDTTILLFQYSVEGICVVMNDNHCFSYENKLSLITFDAVETDKYTVLVAGYGDNFTEGTFTLSVECDQPRLEPSKELSSLTSLEPSKEPSGEPSSVK